MKKLISDIISVMGVLSFVVGIVLMNLFLVIFGIIAITISILLPYPE